MLLVVLFVGAPAVRSDESTAAATDRSPYAWLFPFGVRGRVAAYEALPVGAKRYRAVQSGLRWLAAHQSEGGGWEAAGFTQWCDGERRDVLPALYGKAVYNPGISGIVLTAFLGAGHGPGDGGPYDAVVRRGLDYLHALQDKDGCIGPRVDKRFIYNHAFGTLALVEAYAASPTAALRETAQKALDFSELCRNPYFAWRYGVKAGDNDTSVTAAMVEPHWIAHHVDTVAREAGLAAPFRIDLEVFDGARAWLDKMTDAKTGRVGYIVRGGVPPRPEEEKKYFPPEKTESTTAAGMLLRLLLPGGDPKEDASHVKDAIRLLRAQSPKWDTSEGTIDFCYWYYGALAMHHARRSGAARWSHVLARELVEAQCTEGDVCEKRGSWDPKGPWGQDGGRVTSTALAVLCLEAPDRCAIPESRQDVLLRAVSAADLGVGRRLRIVEALSGLGVEGAEAALVPLLAEPESRIRAAALLALRRLDLEPGTVQRTGQALQDPEVAVRRAAAQALAGQGDRAAPVSEALLRALDDEDLQVRINAATTLGYVGVHAAVEPLRGLLAHTDLELRVAAAAALLRITGDVASTRAALSEGLEASSSTVRAAAAGHLAAVPDAVSHFLAALETLLKDESPLARVQAARALWPGSRDRAPLVAALASALVDTEPHVLLLALEPLRLAGDLAGPAVAPLQGLLFHAQRVVRVRAAQTLGAIGPEGRRALAGLWSATLDEDEATAGAAREALENLGGDVSQKVEVLVQAFAAADERLTHGAVTGLVALGPAGVPLLAARIDGADTSTKLGILSALGALGEPARESAPAVLHVLEQAGEERVRARAAATLGAIGPHGPDALVALARCAEKDTHAVAEAAATAIGRIRPTSPDAVASLVRCVAKETNRPDAVRKAAASALGTMGPDAAPAVDALIAVFGDGSGDSVRSSSMLALGRLGAVAVGGLREALKSADVKVQDGAVHALGYMESAAAKPAVPDLLVLLEERAVKGWAFPVEYTLGRIGKPAVSGLAKLLRHSEPRVREAAANSLGIVGKDARSTLSALRKLLKDPYARVRSAAARTIERIRGG